MSNLYCMIYDLLMLTIKFHHIDFANYIYDNYHNEYDFLQVYGKFLHYSHGLNILSNYKFIQHYSCLNN